MRIVVLDGYTLNPGDLDWKPLRDLGECTVYDRTMPAEVQKRAADAEILLTNKTVLSRDILAGLPTLRYVGVLATGYNVVDVQEARRRGVTVTNVPGYSTESVAQMVFAHLLNLVQATEAHAQAVRQGGWSTSPDFSFRIAPLAELTGKTMGIVGPGAIGRAVARIAQAFGMNVIVTGRSGSGKEGLQHVQLEELLMRSDVVSLHCPLTEQTRNLLNADRLAMMKPTAYLVNTARGPLVDEQALADALNGGRLAGAGLDVLSAEPPLPSNPLLSARNCHITPHIAWTTLEARTRLLAAAVENVRTFLSGNPVNVVL